MIYDEKKSPYQYSYGTPIIVNSPDALFDLNSELNRIENSLIFSKNPHILDNYIKFYNIKEKLLNLVFSLIPQERVKNISIGGAYLFKKMNKFSDIDLNIIVDGDFFAYMDLPVNFTVDVLQSIQTSKVSIMVFGDNYNIKKMDTDFIVTPNYIHRDLRMREGLSRGFRNINIYGNIYETDTNSVTFLHNITTRVKRQLKFASLIYDGLFDHYNSEDRVVSKMSSRIGEAGMFLFASGMDLDFEKYHNLYVGTYTPTLSEIYSELLYLDKIIV